MLSTVLDCAGRALDLTRPQVMGILNITPDSFSDGGQLWRDHHLDRDRLRAQARAMVAGGAAVLDVGGESTRPGAAAVSLQEECDRVLPVVEWLVRECDAIVSVDTSSPELMREAMRLGAGMINDVRALSRPGALAAAAAAAVPVVLMHMQGEPATMQQAPQYTDVAAEVRDGLLQRVAACEAAGIVRSRIVLDPGFGFGKTVAHNLSLLKHLPLLAATGLPLLAGLSRKSLIGAVTGSSVGDRLPGSVALAVLAAERGARLLRVHDVAATVAALQLLAAVEDAQ